MPLNPGPGWFGNVSCHNPECHQPADFRILDGDDTGIATCYDHEDEAITWLHHHLGQGQVGACVACGSTARTYRVDLDGYYTDLCAGHAIALLSLTLMPDAWRRLAHDAGDPDNITLLGEDAYIDGIAYQPSTVTLLTARAALKALPELPGPDDLDDENVDPLPSVTDAAIADYRVYTGLEISRSLARDIIGQQIIHEAGARIFGFGQPTPAIRATIRNWIQKILAEEDPLGLVGSGAEAEDPYHREAAWWADRIHGDESGPNTFALRMNLCFDPDATRRLELRPEPVYARIAQRLYDEVSVPLARIIDAEAEPSD